MFDGTLALVYETDGRAANISAAFQIVRRGFSPALDKPGEATLAVTTAAGKLKLRKERTATVCLAAEKGRVIVGAPSRPLPWQMPLRVGSSMTEAPSASRSGRKPWLPPPTRSVMGALRALDLSKRHRLRACRSVRVYRDKRRGIMGHGKRLCDVGWHSLRVSAGMQALRVVISTIRGAA